MATALYNSSLLKLFMCFMYTFLQPVTKSRDTYLNESYKLEHKTL